MAYPQRTRIEVDFNNRGHGGLVLGHARHASGPLEIGQSVLVTDSPEAMAYAGRVEMIEPTGRVWLHVFWRAA